MTEEAKKNLLDYMLGKMPSESGVDEPQFGYQKEIVNNLSDYLYNELGGDSPYYINGTIQANSINNQGSNLSIVYGYSTNNRYAKLYGFLLILDDNFNVLKLITEYDSGTILGEINVLNVDEDGNFYGIETTYDSKTKRFIMLNNFSLEQNNLTLRQNYNLPSNISSATYYNAILKSPGASKYLISGTITENYLEQPIATELTINVGSENSWQEYRYGGEFIGNGATITSTWANWNNDELIFKMAGFNSDAYCEYYSSDDKILVNTYEIPYENSMFFPWKFGSKILSEDKTYISVYGNDNDKDQYYVYKVENSKIEQIYFYETDYEMSGMICGITLFSKDSDMFFLKLSKKDGKSNVYSYSLAKIIDTQIYEYFIDDVEETANLLIFNITRQFNLYNFYIQNINTVYKVSQIYNSNQYNGEPFTNKNSLNPNNAILYSDNNPVFARNLYNKTQNGATTTSTIEIPNNYLNDTLVDQKDLMSVNNNVIISDTNGFTKNVYETVYLNFVNTISVVNQNETQSVYNNNVATKLNTSINNPTNYDDLKLTKYRINYQDGTNTVSTPQATLQDDGSYQLLMTFYLSKFADTLELISEDEQTVYLTYNLTNTETNKYYSFKQRVRIGGN